MAAHSKAQMRDLTAPRLLNVTDEMMDDFRTECVLYTIRTSFKKTQASTRAVDIEVIELGDEGNRRFLQRPDLSLLPLMGPPRDESRGKGETSLVGLPYSSRDEN